jgi:hypothetical protein
MSGAKILEKGCQAHASLFHISTIFVCLLAAVAGLAEPELEGRPWLALSLIEDFCFFCLQGSVQGDISLQILLHCTSADEFCGTP